MRIRLWFAGPLILLLRLSLVGSVPPWPTPPPDDDDILFTRAEEYHKLVGIIDHLLDHSELVEGHFGSGGLIFDISSSVWRDAESSFYSVDFLFWLGAASDPGYGRFKVLRVTHREIEETGRIEIDVSQSPDLVLWPWPDGAPSTCFANSMDTLRACHVALSDSRILQYSEGAIPYFLPRSISTPICPEYAPGTVAYVEIEFECQGNPSLRHAFCMDVGVLEDGMLAVVKAIEKDK